MPEENGGISSKVSSRREGVNRSKGLEMEIHLLPRSGRHTRTRRSRNRQDLRVALMSGGRPDNGVFLASWYSELQSRWTWLGLIERLHLRPVLSTTSRSSPSKHVRVR